MYEISKALYNKNYPLDTNNLIMKAFDQNNPVHRGIMIGLLLEFQYDRLSPFFPLTSYPYEFEMVKSISDQQITKVLEILKASTT